jgi:hypothetical protein
MKPRMLIKKKEKHLKTQRESYMAAKWIDQTAP